MNVAETTDLCRKIAKAFPHQTLDDETPAIWSRVLAAVRHKDAVEVVVTLCGQQNFISPADILTGVKAVRAKRLEGVDRIAYLAETPQEWRAIIARVADGEVEVPPLALEQPEARRAIEVKISDLFQRPPRPTPIDMRPKALPPAPSVDPVTAQRAEAERARQLADLQAYIDQDGQEAAS